MVAGSDSARLESGQGVNADRDRPDHGWFDRQLTAARRHDPDGFAQLFEHYGPAVRAVAVAESAPEPDAVVNAVFVAAFDDLDRFVGDHGDFCAFLYLITRFRLIDEARARSRAVVADDDLTMRLVNDQDRRARSSSPDPDSPDSLAFLVANATKLLSSIQREVLALRIYFGLTAPEVARALAVPLADVLAVQDRVRNRFERLGTG